MFESAFSRIAMEAAVGAHWVVEHKASPRP